MGTAPARLNCSHGSEEWGEGSDGHAETIPETKPREAGPAQSPCSHRPGSRSCLEVNQGICSLKQIQYETSSGPGEMGQLCRALALPLASLG